MENIPLPNNSPLPQTPPISPPPTGDLPHPPRFPLFLIVGAIILVSLIATGAYFLGKSQNSLKVMTTSPSPTSITSSPSSIPPADPTANWKTYTNTKYGFTIKYPENIFPYTREDLSAGVYFASKEGEGEAKGSPMALGKDDLWMGISFYSFSGSVEEFMNKVDTKYYYSQAKNIGPTTVNNNPATRLLLDNPPNASEENYNYMIIWKRNDYIVTADLGSYQKETLFSNQHLLDQILSTFKFLDNNKQTDDTSSLKTYSNSTYKIAFQYPISASGLSKPPRELNNSDAKQFVVTIDLPPSSFTLDIQQRDETKNYLDNPPITTYTAKTLTWDVFISKTGYCDGPTCGRPFVAYQMYKNGYRYVFEFKNQTEISQLQKTIVSSFQFL